MFGRLFLWALVVTLFIGSFGVVFASGASDIPTPFVPEITVTFVDASYPVTTTNPYTGLDETTQICNKSIKITINNQPFDYPDHKLYYKVRIKPHFGEYWKDIRNNVPQSNSSNTLIISYVVPTSYYKQTGYDISRDPYGDHAVLPHIPDGSQLDFQVQALVGHIAQKWVSDYPSSYGITRGYYQDCVEVDTTSSWSETQTVTITSNNGSVAGKPEINDNKITSVETTNDNERGALDLTWVPKDDESVKVEEVVALVGIVAVFVAIAVGVVYFKVRKH